jgi:hypothetical protein
LNGPIKLVFYSRVNACRRQTLQLIGPVCKLQRKLIVVNTDHDASAPSQNFGLIFGVINVALQDYLFYLLNGWVDNDE